jgi:hypothetical protein
MQPVAHTDQEVNCMFYPPSLLDPTPTPKPVPIYDTPIADRQPVRALAWGIAGGMPGTAPRVVVLEGSLSHEGGWK